MEKEIKLKVTGAYKENLNRFYTVKYAGEEHLVPMLKFQEGLDFRKIEIDCIIHTDDRGIVNIVQDYATIISQLYEVGKQYQFFFKENLGSYSKVLDVNKIAFRLENVDSKTFYIGEPLIAKVISISGTKVGLEYVPQIEQIEDKPFLSPELLSNKSELEPSDKEYFLNLINKCPYYEKAKTLIGMRDDNWVMEFLNHTDELLLKNRDNILKERPLIKIFGRICIYMVEESPMLKNRNHDEREKIVLMLSIMAQHAEDYVSAYNIISANDSKRYVTKLLDNLSESGNLYKPESKFRIMMCIFNLDEAIMSEMMDRIFEIILNGEKSNWEAEPFRTAFVNLLELFIKEYRVKATKSSGVNLLHKMIKAIAIQQLLTKNEDDIDRRLNRATFFRLLSYVQRFSSREMLDIAFYSLFTPYDEKLAYEWDDISNIDNLYYKIAYSPNLKVNKAMSTAVYQGKHVELIVNTSSINIRPNVGAQEKVNGFNSLIDWEGFELYTSEPIKTKIKEKGNFGETVRFWKRFRDDALFIPKVKQRIQKLEPSVNDNVTIQIIDDDPTTGDLFCIIKDEAFKGQGWLPVNQVTKFLTKKDCGIELFQSTDGKPLLYNATVIGAANQDDENNLEFSLLDEVTYYTIESYPAGSEITVGIRGKDRNDPDALIGISTDGLSCRIHFNRCMDAPRLMVKCRVREISSTKQIECDYLCMVPEEFCDTKSAVRKLMLNIGFSNLEYDQEKEIEQLDTISEDQMDEIIGITDRLAVIQENRAMAYSILSLNQILCRMADRLDEAEYYDLRKQILIAFDSYEKNGFIPDEIFSIFKDKGDKIIESDYQINEALNKFLILDTLNKKTDTEILLDIRAKSSNPSIKDAADLAISILLTNRFDIQKLHRSLTERINSILGVKIQKSKLRDFGIETQEIEYKSSIVYPAGNKMQPAPHLQGAVIMQTICGFLNSDKGGTLFLGINKNGAACGIEEDLRYLNLDQDGFGRYVHRMINNDLGQLANQCCLECDWMEDGGYYIYVMKIKPAPDLIDFHGQYWIRQDTEKRPLKTEFIEGYRNMHKNAYHQYQNKQK